MYNRRRKKTIQTELKFVEFHSPLSNRLRADNRWVRFGKLIPWDEFEQDYAANFSSSWGNEALPFRVALGRLVVKEQLGLADRDVVEQITENPYIQHFLGYTEFLEEPPFDASLLVHFRKCIPQELLLRINKRIALGTCVVDVEKTHSDDDNGDAPKSGKLVIDATCVPEDVKHSTDLGLLNDVRKTSEVVIDLLWEALPLEEKQNRRQPRTYRRKVRQAFLAIIRQKNPKFTLIRKGIRKQLAYLNRNLGTVEALVTQGASLSGLPPSQYRKLLVASEVLRQQRELYSRRSKQDRHLADRIVSICKPHVRPIVQGKAAAAVEFGAKISASVIDGMFFLDRHCRDAYSECGDLISQAERFKERTGYYPESIHADKIYRAQDNRAWCKRHGIRLSGPALGRPTTDEKQKREQLKVQRRDELDRIEIESCLKRTCLPSPNCAVSEACGEWEKDGRVVESSRSGRAGDIPARHSIERVHLLVESGGARIIKPQ